MSTENEQGNRPHILELTTNRETGSEVPTSQINALAEGAHQVRQYTFSILWSDEFAFQEKQEETQTAAKPTLDGGGKHILTSSANGNVIFFYRLA